MVGSFTVTNQIYDSAMDLTMADIVVPAGGSGIAPILYPNPRRGPAERQAPSGPAIQRIRRRFSDTPFLNALKNFSGTARDSIFGYLGRQSGFPRCLNLVEPPPGST